ncbi:MAG: phage holin family protein [Candidatus Pacebacteria bacterium]|jgi:putative membrane protein|nr:phage holin family protein [Candidatus Paceibacterota bacterium]
MLSALVIGVLTNAVAIYIAGQVVPGFIVLGNDFQTLVTAGFVLGLINFFVKPFLKLLSLPFVLLTFGLFTIVINVAMLFLLDYALLAIQIEGFWAAFWAMLVISAVNIFIGFFSKK